MNKENLKLGLLVGSISIIMALAAVLSVVFNKDSDNVGNLVFANVYNNGVDLSHIEIIQPDIQIDLFLEKDFWTIKQADSYYANLKLMSSFLQEINSARFYSSFDKEKINLEKVGLTSKNAIIVNMFNNKQLLDGYILGNITPNGKYRYITMPSSDKVWLADINIDIPKKLMSWVEQPVTEYTPDSIEEIKIDDISNIRTDSYKPFNNGRDRFANRAYFLEQFSFLVAENILSDKNFNKKNFIYTNNIKLVSFMGLVTDINVYSDNKDYWVKIKISATTLPTSRTRDYIDNNSFLYNGWFFKIPKIEGDVLLNYKLS